MGVELHHEDSDLKLGQVGEQLLADLLQSKSIEVVVDFYASITGNLSIEYMRDGTKSGISTTKAKWWAFIIAEDKLIFLIEVEKLKDIARQKYLQGSTKTGEFSSKLIVIPVSEVLELITTTSL